jgi:Holliday junction resolvasome RuvABC endonuclease subunit
MSPAHQPIAHRTGKEPIMAHVSLTPKPMSASVSGAPVVLALDLGTTTGWALRAASGLITSGTVSFRPSRYDGGGMRYVRFRAWLDQLAADAGPISAIHFEEVRRHIGTDAAHLYGGFLATLTACCEQRGVAYQGVPVGTIKRHVTGKGNADKAAVIAAIRARGFDPADDNEADALAILLWVTETNGGLR